MNNKGQMVKTQNGKGMRPKIGYNYKKWDENWEKIFGKKKDVTPKS